MRRSFDAMGSIPQQDPMSGYLGQMQLVLPRSFFVQQPVQEDVLSVIREVSSLLP